MAVGDPVRDQSSLAAALISSNDERLVLDLNLVLIRLPSAVTLIVLLHMLAAFASRDIGFDEVV